ncbi:Hypothetical protein CpMEX30_0109 [Corynebacterium pseudotuberculosis]|nr:Hypothetical protein CpMEX30_0109 [Corynebacterium pseudotuberculosis]
MRFLANLFYNGEDYIRGEVVFAQDISKAIDRIVDDIDSLRKLLTSPEEINFSEMADSFVKLEQAFSFKAYSDAFVAYCAHINNAGTLVGEQNPSIFLLMV